MSERSSLPARGNTRKPLAIILSIAITALGLSVAPLAVESASATSVSTLKTDILKDLNKWRAEQGAPALKIYPRLSASVQAQSDAQLAEISGISSADAKLYIAFLTTPMGGNNVFPTGGFARSGSTSAMALEIAQEMESPEAATSTFLDDNYAGIGIVDLDGQWDASLTAETFTSLTEQSTAPKVTITGTVKAGSVLTAHSSITASSTTTLAYDWLVNGVQVSDATDSTFTIPVGTPFYGGGGPISAVGQKITAIVTDKQGDKDINAGFATSATVAFGTVKTSPVFVNGDRYVGDTLTANTGTWSPAQTQLGYQWYRDDSPIQGATESTYSQVANDVNHEITVRVTGSTGFDAYLSASIKTTTTHKTAGPQLDNTTPPSINGDDIVGATLTADNGEWTDGTSTTAQTFAYQWSVGGTAVSGATKSTFVVPTSAYSATGKTITVAVTAKETGFSNTTVTSAATDTIAGLSFDVTGSPTYSGTLAVGKTLKAVLPTYSPKPTTITYKWQIDGVTKSTSSSYKIPASAVGKTITLLVSASKSGYVTSSTGDDDIEVPGDIE
jgi:hypothetical protein